MGIMDKIIDSMKDQQGLFRGGKEGRMFGRATDAVEDFNQGPTYEFMSKETIKDIISRPDQFHNWATKYVDKKHLSAVANDVKTYLGQEEGNAFLEQNLIIPQQRMNFKENYSSRDTESVDVRDIVLERSRAKKVPGEINQRKIEEAFGSDLPMREYANPTDGNPYYNRGTKVHRNPDQLRNPKIEDAGY